MPRLYNNTEIQKLIVAKAKYFSFSELEKYCREDYCHEKFNLNYPLFVKVPTSYGDDKMHDAILDHNQHNRWTWKYKFQVGNYFYAITTQWYERNDEYIQKWLRTL